VRGGAGKLRPRAVTWEAESESVTACAGAGLSRRAGAGAGRGARGCCCLGGRPGRRRSGTASQSDGEVARTAAAD
jgi:hypothetical protein